MKFGKQDVTVALIQFAISVLAFSIWYGQYTQLRILIIALAAANLLAVGLSHFSILSFQHKEKRTVFLVNLVWALLFMVVGGLLHEYLSFEIVENVQKDADGADKGAIIVAARVIQYGGKEFTLIYLAHFLISFLYHTLYQKKSPAQAPQQSVLKIKNGAKVHFLPVDNIEWIEAAGNYVEIHGSGEKRTSRTSITTLCEEIQNDSLRRIHRSFIINTKMIKELIPKSDGNAVVLNSGREIKIGRQYKEDLYEYLGIND